VADETVADDEEVNYTTALAALTTDLEIASLRLQLLLGNRPPGQRLATLPKRERAEVRQIQRMFGEWASAFREARRS
jgi:hypothetical protein